MPASSTVFHALAACALAGLCALQTHAQPSIAICGNANQFRPALTVSGFGDDDLNCSVFPTYIGGGLTAPSACGMRTNASDPTATTWRGMLWMAATACCADRVPNSICGPLETVCNRTDQVRWGVTVPQFGGGSCGSVSSSIMSEIPVVGCNGSIFGDTNAPASTHLVTAATQCCTGGASSVNDACGPPPVVGSMCAHPANFTPNAHSPTFNQSCRQIQTLFVGSNLYGDPGVCSQNLPGSGGFPLGSAFALAATECCRGGAVGSTCSAGRVSPCQSPTDFRRNRTVHFSASDSSNCSSFGVLYGLNASSCGDPWPGSNASDGGTVAQTLSIVGRDCCAGGRATLLCGSNAPTAPPSPRPPPVGPTYACGGSFIAWAASAPGGHNCSSLPIASAFFAQPCDSFVSAQGTDIGFFISNGGFCAGFNSTAACTAAAGNISRVLSLMGPGGYADLGNGSQCFLQVNNSCSPYSVFGGVRVTETAQCGAAPNPTQGSMCSNPGTFLPNNTVFDPNTTCAMMEQTFLFHDLFGHPSLCGTRFPESEFTWGGVFQTAALSCCSGPPSITCAAGRVPVCASPSQFRPGNNMSFGAESAACTLGPAMLYGVDASACNHPPPNVDTGGSPVSLILATAGRDCCANGVGNSLCGTLAPTPPPAAPLPRVGPTQPCPGTFSAWYLTVTGGSTCSGQPFIQQSIDTLCGTYTNTDNATEHGFIISNGGLCVGFDTQGDCMAAAGSLGQIVSGTDVQLLTPGGTGQCFLSSTHSCSSFYASFTAASTVPMCSQAPTQSPTRLPTTLSFSPTAVPTAAITTTSAPATAGGSSSGSSSGGGALIPIIIVVVAVVLIVGALVAYSRQGGGASGGDGHNGTMVNPNYEIEIPLPQTEQMYTTPEGIKPPGAGPAEQMYSTPESIKPPNHKFG